MHSHRDKQNDKEETIVEQALENVVLSREKLLGIDLVEDLEEHISIKEECVMAGHSGVSLRNVVASDPSFERNDKSSGVWISEP